MRARSFALLVSAVVVGAGCATGAEDTPSNAGSGGAGGGESSPASTTATSASIASGAGTTTAASSSSEAASSSSSSSTGGGPVCGDGVIEAPETCEDFDFGGKTCATFGLQGGTLVCNSFCGIVLSACTPKESCSNQKDDDQDGLTDCDDDGCATAVGCLDSCASPKALTVGSFEFGDITGRPDTLTLPCSPSGGREIVYTFTAPSSVDIAFDMFFADFDPAVAIRTSCGDATTDIVCKNDNSGSFSTESLSFTAVAGQQYFIVLEAADDAGGSFDFELAEVQPESSCGDLSDDDFDGLLECDDPTACKGTSPDCSPGSGAVGTPCFWPTDCAANQGDPICLTDQLGFAGGYCSEFCDLATNDCPGDAVCADLGLSQNGVCLDGCATTADCQPGYVCLDEGLSSKVCDRAPEVACNDNHDNDTDGLVDCEDGSACSASASCAPGAGAPGVPCQLHNQCSANGNDPYCIDQFTFGWPGGYCSEFCKLGAGDDCPMGSVCSMSVGPSESSSANGLCLHSCTSSADCRPGFTCGSDGVHMVCLH
jgi:hypothetical protein